jgi:carbon monoxide dehydrogenase subunit G
VTHVERSIEVDVPVRTVYDQWTQFEDFPRFMSGVQEVRQVGDALTHWVAEIAGVRREWDAAILEQVPDEKVAWAATSGATNAGAVYFTAVGGDRTQVRLALDYEPEGLVEKIGDVLDVIDRQAVADLDRFKEFIEQARAASGGWRGTVEDGDVQDGGVTAGTAAPEAAAPGVAATGAAAGGGAADVVGDPVAVGPTGNTRGSVATEAGPEQAAAAYGDEDADVGYSGDPVMVEPTGPEQTATGTSGPTAGAASSAAGAAGFGTDTGLSSDDPASGALTGNPGSVGSEGGAATTGGTAWNAEPGTTEATTDPVGESWSDDADATTGAGERGAQWADEPADAGGTTIDPVGESWSEDTETSGGQVDTTGSAAEPQAGTTGSSGSRGGVTTGMGGARGSADPRSTT